MGTSFNHMEFLSLTALILNIYNARDVSIISPDRSVVMHTRIHANSIQPISDPSQHRMETKHRMETNQAWVL